MYITNLASIDWLQIFREDNPKDMFLETPMGDISLSFQNWEDEREMDLNAAEILITIFGSITGKIEGVILTWDDIDEMYQPKEFFKLDERTLNATITKQLVKWL